MEFNLFQNKKTLINAEANGWKLFKFTDILNDETKKATKIKKNDYLENGIYPIIDQGKEFISGYWNDETNLYKDYPVIIFGDHTRALKYINFPMYIGADGVKVLKVKDNINTKYLYYFLQNVDIPNDGYSRHFKYMKEIIIPIPSLEIQNKIVEILDKSKELIEKRTERIQELDQLTKSKFIEMFSNINEYISISEYIESLTAGKSLAGKSECINKVLNSGAVTYDYYDETRVKNLPLDYMPKEDHLVRNGDLLISRMNTAELVGATAYVWNTKDNIYIPDRLWKANIKENVNPIFLWQLLIQNSTKEKIRNLASGTSGSMKNISKSNLLKIPVIKVDIKLQNEFAEFIIQVEKLKKNMEISLQELENNYNSLMQKAFKGELF